MRPKRNLRISFRNLPNYFVIVVVCFTTIIGCNNQSGLTEVTYPRVSATVPTNNAVNIPTNVTISVTFSQAVDPASISSSTFRIFEDTSAIDGRITYQDSTATFTPAASLTPNSIFRAYLSREIRNMTGLSMDSDYEWSFTTVTEQVTDTTSPGISAILPQNNAEDVGIDITLQVAFTEDMDASTISNSTFTLSENGNPVDGTVTCSDSIATFAPTEDLVNNKSYTATITTGVEDMSGNALASDYAWSFTTENEENIDTNPPGINSTNPADNAENIALDTNIQATFTEEINTSTITSTTFTLSANGNSIDGTVSSSGSTATINPTSDLEENTTYTATVTTGVRDLVGNAMETNYVWNFTTVGPSDNTPPTVTTTNPASNAENISISTAITAGFSEPMNPSTLNNATFLVELGNTVIAGTVSYSGTTVVFTPNTDLKMDESYSATITTGVQDLAGNPLSKDFVWKFNTEKPDIDDVSPEITSTDPDDGQENVLINATINATFSEEMNTSTLSTATFILTSGETEIEGSVNYSGNTASFNPGKDLQKGTTYTARITTGAEDVAGNPLENDYQWTFTTEEEEVDDIPPRITETNPENEEEDVSRNVEITVTFSEPMNPDTFTDNTVKLQRRTWGFLVDVSGSIRYSDSDRTMTFIPDDRLRDKTDYFVTITIGVTDLAGNNLSSKYSWTFETEDDDDD